MKKLIAFLTLALLMALSSVAIACTTAPQPTGSIGNSGNPYTGYISKIVGNGSVWIVTFHPTSGGDVSSAIDFGAASGLTWTGTWQSVSGAHILTLSTSSVAVRVNGVDSLFPTGGGLVGAAHSWNDFTPGAPMNGVTGIVGLGAGQQNIQFQGLDGRQRENRLWLAGGFCHLSQQDLDAVGLGLMPQEKPEPRLWWML